MLTHKVDDASRCICGLIHWRPGCLLAAEMDRAVWRAKQDAREAAQGFRWANVTSPWWSSAGRGREERPYAVQWTVGDFVDTFR